VPTVEESITVRAPRDSVFAAVTDPRRATEWSPRIIEVRDITPYPPREGTTWRQTAGMAGQTATMLCRIVRLNPPHMGILEISGGDQNGRLTTHCTDVPGATRVTQTLEFQVPGGIKGKMMAAVAGPMLQREMSQALARMRDTLEREAGG
jgi:uncharacterized protein YndB with AHSA1/START domain